MGALIATIVTYFYSLATLVWVSIFVSSITIFICMFIVEAKNYSQDKCSSVKHFFEAIESFTKKNYLY